MRATILGAVALALAAVGDVVGAQARGISAGDSLKQAATFLPHPAQRPIQRAALAAFAEFHAQSAESTFKVIFDPLSVAMAYSPSYEELGRRDISQASGADLDSLAGALGAPIATDQQMGGCSGTPRRCGRITTPWVMFVQVGEPSIRNDTAVVYLLGRHLNSVGRTANIQFSDSYLIRLVRSDGVWKSESIRALCSVTRCTRAGNRALPRFRSISARA